MTNTLYFMDSGNGYFIDSGVPVLDNLYQKWTDYNQVTITTGGRYGGQALGLGFTGTYAAWTSQRVGHWNALTIGADVQWGESNAWSDNSAIFDFSVDTPDPNPVNPDLPGLPGQSGYRSQVALQFEWAGGDTNPANLVLVTGQTNTGAGTKIARAVGALSGGPGSFNSIEMYVNFSTVSGEIEVKVNGATVLHLTSIDTLPYADYPFVQHINVGANWLNYWGDITPTPPRTVLRSTHRRFCNLYIDTGRTYYSALAGGGSAVPQQTLLYPMGIGPLTQWAEYGDPCGRNWVAAQQISANPGGSFDGSFYLEATASGLRDLYQMQDVSTASGLTVYGVQALMLARNMDGSNPANVAFNMRVGAASQDGTGVTLPPTTFYKYIHQIVPLSPLSGTEWTDVELNETYYGPYASSAGGGIHVRQCALEVMAVAGALPSTPPCPTGRNRPFVLGA